MTDATPEILVAPAPPRRDRRILATVLVSGGLHLLLVGLVLLPRLGLPDPTEPPAVNVDLVPPSAIPPEPSSAPPSSEAPSSAAPSSEAPSSEAPSSEMPSSEPSSSPPPSSAEAASAASEPASSAVASTPPPAPMLRPVVIPVGPSEPSSAETSSASEPSASQEESSASASASAADAEASASSAEAPSQLATTDPAAATDAGPTSEATAAPPPSLKGTLRAARRFYLAEVLNAPAMARARNAIAKLPPDKRLAQTCNIEAIGQIGNAGRRFDPDALVANAFVPPAIAGTSFTVKGGAFRSAGKWYAIAYACTLSRDLTAVESFSYRIGADVTDTLKSKLEN